MTESAANRIANALEKIEKQLNRLNSSNELRERKLKVEEKLAIKQLQKLNGDTNG